MAASQFALALSVFSFVSAIALRFLDLANEMECPHKEEPTNLSISNFIEAAKTFPRLFWVLVLTTTLFYVDILSYLIFASGIIVEDWLSHLQIEEAQEDAGKAISALFICCFFLLPVLGYFVDKFGRRTQLLLVAGILAVASHILFIFMYPIVPMILLGAVMSLAAAVVWPTMAYLIPNKLLGFGYGLMSVLQNIGLGIVPIIVVSLKAKIPSNMTIHYFFIFTSVMTLIVAGYLCHLDSHRLISLDSSDQGRLFEELEDHESTKKVARLEEQKDTEAEPLVSDP